MAKFYGKIGYGEQVENVPGVWEEQITERFYYGDILRNARSLQNSQNLNNDININNQFSIIADPFAIKNFHLMRYLEFMNVKWKITSVEVQFPRLLLTVGGVYNEEQA